MALLFYLPVLLHPRFSVFFVAGEAQRAEQLHGYHQQQGYKFNSLHLKWKAAGNFEKRLQTVNNNFAPGVNTTFPDFSFFFLRALVLRGLRL